MNIAQRALELNRERQLKPYIDLPRMAERAQRMSVHQVISERPQGDRFAVRLSGAYVVCHGPGL